jgi:hypothetical protein
MKFPLANGTHTAHPVKAVCPQCKKKKVLEPHSMAIFAGGSVYTGRKRGIRDELDGFASITWHGAHDTGIGDDREIYTSTDVARDCQGGQFEIYFCSMDCLRAFFNSWVDALEAKVQKEKQRMQTTAITPETK